MILFRMMAFTGLGCMIAFGCAGVISKRIRVFQMLRVGSGAKLYLLTDITALSPRLFLLTHPKSQSDGQFDCHSWR
jgi:hypothetical protein